MSKLQRQRKSAVNLWLKKADNDIPMLLDYQLDTLLREMFKLPPREDNTLPYEGWMIGAKAEKTEEMRISPTGISLIKRWEGFRSKAYLCPANVWTIGYGHTKTARAGQRISELQARALLMQDVQEYEKAVNRLVTVQLTQNQFDALVSFAFNVGIGALATSTLRKRLNKGQYELAARELDRWVHGGGRKLPGLASRRKEEKEMFLRS